MLSKNGLPLKIQYCVRCNLSNQQPTSTNEYFHTKNTKQKTVKFDDKGVCSACNFNDLKWNKKINWEEREKELVDLCNKYRKDNGEYDCLIGGSGGKDSVYQSWILKYKYKMNPLTVTWAPHIYTEVGWSNFQKWINKGGFDNYLFTPNGKIHRKITRESTINLLHPFQPFIIGQKTFCQKMADRFNIPIIFWGEMPGEGGKNISHKIRKFGTSEGNEAQKGFEIDPLEGKKFEEAYIGGKQVQEYIDEGISKNDLHCYKPLDPTILQEKKIQFYFLGYFLRWVPQENYYFACEKIDFSPNSQRTEGTYQKYQSIDDKTDGFFFYTRFIKFGVGRTMIDSSQEIRNGHITKDEGLSLIGKYDGEYPHKYENEFLDYISMSKDEFSNLCDKFRPEHLWQKKSNRWELKEPISDFFEK